MKHFIGYWAKGRKAKLSLGFVLFALTMPSLGTQAPPRLPDEIFEATVGSPRMVKSSEVRTDEAFELIFPHLGKEVTVARKQWWSFPKTTLRPPFAVLEMAFRVGRSPNASFVLAEWKHVRGIPALGLSAALLGHADPMSMIHVTSGPGRVGTIGDIDISLVAKGLGQAKVEEIWKSLHRRH